MQFGLLEYLTCTVGGLTCGRQDENRGALAFRAPDRADQSLDHRRLAGTRGTGHDREREAEQALTDFGLLVGGLDILGLSLEGQIATRLVYPGAPIVGGHGPPE